MTDVREPRVSPVGGDPFERALAGKLLEVAETIRPPASWLRVVEVGPGLATHPYLEVGARVVRLDASRAHIDALARCEHRFHAMLAHRLDQGFPEGVRPDDADLVIASGVLHGGVALESALEVLARALAPGGVVAFTHPLDAGTCDVIERATASHGWVCLLRDSVLVELGEGRARTVGRVVARDPRPAEVLPDELHGIDRTACVDRQRVLAAFRRTPFVYEPGSATGRELFDALCSSVQAGSLDLRQLPWPPVSSRPTQTPGCHLLAILPHPDDESVYAGGTIAGIVAAGYDVHLAVATDGAGGRGGADLRRRRGEELLAAAALLGVESLECFGWRDFGKYHDATRTRPFTAVDALRTWPLEASLRRVIRCIRAHRPTVVLSLDPEVDPNYSLHAHHLALGVLATVAFHLAADPTIAPEEGPPWAADEHRVMSPLVEAGESLEVDRVRKRAALAAHASQRYSTESLQRALADPQRPALEASRRMQVRCAVPLWLARAGYRSEDVEIDWSCEADRVLAFERPRSALVDAARAQADARPADPAVRRALDRLADPRCVTVTTGQQVGLLGGPAFTLHKALAAVALAERIERAGVPAVAVFWMATYDHDLDEVRTVPRLERPALRLPLPHDGRAVGPRPLGDGIRLLLDTWWSSMGSGSDDLRALLQRCFRPDATFAEAFACFLADVTHGMGLVLLDPSDPRLCALARPVLARELVGPTRMDEPLRAARARLRASGCGETIETTREVLQAFVTSADGKRHRLRPTAAGVAWSGGELDLHEVSSTLAREPGVFTPAALLRPLVQDAILPTIAYVAGPTEARYLAQLTEAYTWAGIPMPRVIRRPSVHVLGHGDVSTLADVGSRDGLAARAHPLAEIGRAGLPADTGRWFDELEALTDRVASARRTVETGAPVDWVELQAAWHRLDASAAAALAAAQRVLPTWTSAMRRATASLDALGDAPTGTRPLTQMLRLLTRVRRSLLREGRRARPAAIRAWWRAAPVPVPGERRASVAELLARFGPDAPRVILAALQRNFAPEVVVQGEESV